MALIAATFGSSLLIADDQNRFTISQKTLVTARQEYGQAAERRLLEWQTLIRDNQFLDERAKLEITNEFFNRAQFVDDPELWGRRDYWATPVEFLTHHAGDCEDYSIAKYFTLKALGLATEKMRITYTTSLAFNQAHMVLAFYPTPTAEPLILDNINSSIEPASRRRDLKPVYSFNADSLWLNRSRNEQLKAGNIDQLKPWQDLTNRMENGD